MDPQDHDQEPRIVARGEWSQDEFGDILYTPAGHRPALSDDPAHPGWDTEAGPDEPGNDPPNVPRNDPWADLYAPPYRGDHGADGYRPRSDDVWDRARADYLAGETAASVCDRHGISLGTLKSRAAREGWRRCDQPDPAPVDMEAERAAGLPDPSEMAAHALVRADRAMRLGRAAEAGSWVRLYQRLTTMIVLPGPQPQPQPQPQPVETPRTAPRPAPVSHTRLAVQARALEGLARDVAALAHDDHAGQARLGALLERLREQAGQVASIQPPSIQAASISDDSDHSDPVSHPPESEPLDDGG